MVICAGIGWALVDHARGELLEKPLRPNPAPGTEAALTKNVPPSPWKLGETISATFSRAKKESERVRPPGRPRNPPRATGPDARAELVPESASSRSPRRTIPANRSVAPAPPDRAPTRPESARPPGLMAEAELRGSPTLAR